MPYCLHAIQSDQNTLVGVELEKGGSLAYNLHAICYPFGNSKVAAEVV